MDAGIVICLDPGDVGGVEDKVPGCKQLLQPPASLPAQATPHRDRDTLSHHRVAQLQKAQLPGCGDCGGIDEGGSCGGYCYVVNRSEDIFGGGDNGVGGRGESNDNYNGGGANGEKA